MQHECSRLSIITENQKGSDSPKLANGGSGVTASRESVAGAVRARRLRRLERPLSLADCAPLPALLSLAQSRAHSANLEQPAEQRRSAGDGKRRVAESRSSGELAGLAGQRAPRRSASVADMLLRRKQARPPCHVIENPMHEPLQG